jgi:hypothetical protein
MAREKCKQNNNVLTCVQVCTQGTDFAPHLTYNNKGTTYHQDSANFIAAAFKGMPLPAKPVAPGPAQGATPPPPAAPLDAPPSPQAVPLVAVSPKGPPLGAPPLLASRSITDLGMALVMGGGGRRLIQDLDGIV